MSPASTVIVSTEQPQPGTAGRGSTLLPAPATFQGKFSEVAKGYVEAVRAELAEAHWAGAGGVEIASQLATCIDNLIRFIFEAASARYGRRYTRSRQHCAVIALGGYGRGEQAPRSDIDLLVLHAGAVTPFIETVTESLLYALWDAGLDVGHSVRNTAECVSLASGDLTIKTSMLDGRFVCGSPELGAEFREQVQAVIAAQDVEGFTRAKMEESASRHQRQGDSVFVLEPNLKEGAGGLRDLHTALWIAHVQRGVIDLEALHEQAIVTDKEFEELAAAREFLFRVRNCLHFLLGTKTDQLSVERREAVANRLGYAAEGDHSPGDMFLRDYYHHASVVARTCDDIVDRLRVREEAPGLFERLVKKRTLRPGISLVSERVVAEEAVFEERPVALLEIFAEAQRMDAPLSAETRELVRRSAGLLTPELAAGREAVDCFLSILQAPEGVYRALAQMNRLGVLGAMIPEFGRLFCMVQHDYYHVYTVDEHSLIGVRELERLRSGYYRQASPFITRIMQDCDRPDLLFLAMLFHDLGKGYGGDHDERGAVMSVDIARRLGLNEDDTATLEFLVRHHLDMSMLAQTRDIEDPELVMDFVRLVGTPRNLRLLYLLTFADMKAVGPQIWNGWKDHLLAELYQRAIALFHVGAVSEVDLETRAQRTRDRLIERIRAQAERHRLADWLATMSEKYLLAFPDETIIDHWRLFESMDSSVFRSGVIHHPDRDFSEFTLCARDRPGLFASIAGVLSSEGLEILSSRLETSSTGWVMDVFHIDHEAGGPAADPEVWERVRGKLEQVLSGRTEVWDVLASLLAHRPARVGEKRRAPRPARVEIDNQVSADATVIDVYAGDRPALLFRIANAIFHSGLDVRAALINTHLHEVLDVFYVTDARGNKIEDPAILESITRAIVEGVEGRSGESAGTAAAAPA